MFKCARCDKMTRPNESQNKVIFEEREKKYVNKVKGKRGTEQLKETTGSEIVIELSICSNCYSELKDKNLIDEKGRYKKYVTSKED